MDGAVLESLGAALLAQAETLGSIERHLAKLAAASERPQLPPEHQWVDIDGARRILSMERRQFIERIAPRPDFPRAARIDGVGRPRWRASEVSTWLELHKRGTA